jgi:hypothetical protein
MLQKLLVGLLLCLVTRSEAFFQFGGAKRATTRGVKEASPLAKEAVRIYTTKYAKQLARNKDSRYAYPESTLIKNFAALTAAIKDDERAIAVVKVWPDIVVVDSEKIAANFNTYATCFEFDQAVGMITRNPSLLAIAPTGYGSAEAACEKGGKDLMVMSYVISVTRPIGKPLLALLFGCLLKAVVYGPGFGF